jgi:hypothetical protein
MQKAFLLCIVLGSLIYGQTTIPYPPEASQNAELRGGKIIGDFDGDGSNDIYFAWYTTVNGVTQGHFGVYSLKKQLYLLKVLSGVDLSLGFDSGDLNNDSKVELLIGNKIYEYTGATAKKKFPDNPTQGAGEVSP